MFQYRCIANGVLCLIFDNPSIRRIIMLKEERIPFGMGLCSTKVLLEIPNDSIESAKRISEEINAHIQDDDWGTITPIEVLERVLDDRTDRFYEEDGDPRTCDYDDLVHDSSAVFNYFVYEYEQYI